jgi:hypothetical protein
MGTTTMPTDSKAAMERDVREAIAKVKARMKPAPAGFEHHPTVPGLLQRKAGPPSQAGALWPHLPSALGKGRKP